MLIYLELSLSFIWFSYSDSLLAGVPLGSPVFFVLPVCDRNLPIIEIS
jgi:hypothetical protein